MNGEKVTKQRRIILHNLNEAYIIFKQQYPHVKIGFSKFAEYRPKEILLTMDRCGIHYVCVCFYHQNVKLIFEALQKNHILERDTTYKDILKKIICKNSTEKCHFVECDNCPNTDFLKEKIRKNLEESMVEYLEIKQWSLAGGKVL